MWYAWHDRSDMIKHVWLNVWWASHRAYISGSENNDATVKELFRSTEEKKKLNHTMELIFLTFLLIFKLNYLGKILLSNINIIDHQESFVLFRFCDWKSKNMENRVLE